MAGNLPTDSTAFIGRRREVAELRRHIAESPAVTIVGPGGIGKTRLALALAADRARAFPDGVWFVPLDGIEDERLLVAQVADVLGIRLGAVAESPTDGLVQGLRNKQLLLILDGCEHLLHETSRLVDAIGRACPKVRVVATSRAPVLTVGHTAYNVPSLAVPGTPAAGKQIDGSDAVQFFLDRARAAQPGFTVGSANRAAVHSLVRSLEGLPLAIELATAQLRYDDVASISRAADQRVLDWDQPDSGATTVRSSLARSAELCTTQERRLWSRLSVFRGTFDLDAVEAVCGTTVAEQELLDALQGLVERSIVERRGGGKSVRFALLDLTRQYGEEMLDESQREDLRRLHTSWYVGLVARARSEWNSAQQIHWLQTLPDDHANLVHTLRFSIEGGDSAAEAAEVICDLWRYYWWALGWLAEGIYWVDLCARVLAGTAPVRGRLLVLGSLLAHTIGDEGSAERWLEEARRCADRNHDDLVLALADHVEGDAAMYDGRLGEAADHFRQALAGYDANSASHRVDTLLMLTLACAAQGDAEGAEAAHLETLFTLDPAERFQRSYSLLFIGEALRRVGDIAQARQVAEAALEINGNLDDPFGRAWMFSILGEIAGDAGEHRRAATLMGAANSQWRTMGIDGSVRERLQIRDDQMHQRVRAVLGTAQFDRCWRDGERLEPGEATDLALGRATTKGTPEEDPTILSSREEEVARLIADGLTNRQIAQRIVVAQRTVDFHVQNIRTKLGLTSRAQVAGWVASRAANERASGSGGP